MDPGTGPELEPEPEPEPAPAPGTGDSDLLERFEAVRERFIALVREWDPTVQGQFLGAPARMEGSALVLGIRQQFALDRLDSPAKRAGLEQIAQTALGEPVELRLEHVPSDSGGEAYTARIARAAGELLGAREIKDV